MSPREELSRALAAAESEADGGKVMISPETARALLADITPGQRERVRALLDAAIGTPASPAEREAMLERAADLICGPAPTPSTQNSPALSEAA